jgi:hypothetical protein
VKIFASRRDARPLRYHNDGPDWRVYKPRSWDECGFLVSVSRARRSTPAACVPQAPGGRLGHGDAKRLHQVSSSIFFSTAGSHTEGDCRPSEVSYQTVCAGSGPATASLLCSNHPRFFKPALQTPCKPPEQRCSAAGLQRHGSKSRGPGGGIDVITSFGGESLQNPERRDQPTSIGNCGFNDEHS